MPTGYKGVLPGEVRRGLSLRFPFTNTVDMVNSGVTAISGSPVIQGGVYNAEGKTAYFDFDAPNDQGGWSAGFTISFWMKIAHSQIDGSYKFLINSNETSPDSVGGMYIIPADFGSVTNGFYLACSRGTTGGRYGASVSNVISDNVWEHFTVVLDNGAYFFYKNGSPVNVSEDDSGSGTGYRGKVGTWRFGASTADGSGAFTGQISDFRMYGTVLNAYEILGVYNASQLSFFGNPYALWLFNEKSIDAANNRVLDLSGNSRHLTRGDGSTTTTFPTKLVRSGYSFDGGDYFANSSISSAPNTAGTMIFRGNALGSGVQSMMILGETATKNSLSYVYDAASSGRVLAYDSSSGATNVITQTIGLSAATTVGISYDASDIKFYVDGRLVSSASRPANVDLSAATKVFIGQTSSSVNYLNGGITGAGIWSSALTPTQHALAHQFFKANETRT